MFKKILVANRGEIAVRVIRACKELGIASVAVYSQADQHSLPVKLADQSICIGSGLPRDSYLNIPAIISAAELTGAEAIHPGYGFLSENAYFSEVCSANGIVFIGASSKNINLMGDKSKAREVVSSLGIPTVPGSDGALSNFSSLSKVASDIGYPLLIKASAGGGGRGMRVVEGYSTLKENFLAASNEARNAFGDDRLYVERYIANPRHIEIQILSDGKRSIHLGERECSIQRRHQKLIEEAPSPFISDQLREEMGKKAVTIAQSIGYHGAGTVEFLVDSDGSYYFMEMNTRIQVEHPVTEAITGIDLVKSQIRIANSGVLSINQSDVQFIGHAIEFRINAENYEKGFMPSPGSIDLFFPPGGQGVRVDSYIYPGFCVPTYYDSLLAKLIIWGIDREEAVARSERALDEFIIDGLDTLIPFHKRVVQNMNFKLGTYTTRFFEKEFLHG